jgi:hypothetical protein
LLQLRMRASAESAAKEIPIVLICMGGTITRDVEWCEGLVPVNWLLSKSLSVRGRTGLGLAPPLGL